jgi:hypothetical protein
MASSEIPEGDQAASHLDLRTASDRHGVKISIEVATPQFRLLSDGGGYSLAEAWSALWQVDPPACPLQLGESAPWPRNRRSAPALLTSFLIHFSVGFFLYSVPLSRLFYRFSGPPPAVRHAPLIVYEFRALKLPAYLPTLHPPGPGGAPGHGAKKGRPPRLGYTRFDPRITIISNPPHPDNSRLTIQNAAAPPELKAPEDLRVPDLILGNLGPAPAPPALPPPPRAAAPPPPVEEPKAPPPPQPVEPAPAPRPATLDLASKLPPLPTPQLEVLPGPTADAAAGAGQAPRQQVREAAPAPSNHPDASAAPDAEKRPGTTQLTTLSVDPIALKDFTSLPPGNRAGAFSIGPAKPERGSPKGAESGSQKGVEGAPLGIGEGGPGPGGDKSVAVGSGHAGGGGVGNSAAAPPLSVTGPAVEPGIAAGTLPPLPPEALVYPVNTAHLKPRAPSIIVSSGPWGGGGLRVYGVLHGGKIYTVYLTMPGKNWILQYCTREDPPKPAVASRVVEVHMQPPVAPPAAIDQFDFHRPPVTQDPAATMIILHGHIREDGSVENLEILQGVEPTINEAARAAFARWKFSPALQAGNPVAVEILVGVPAIVPGS